MSFYDFVGVTTLSNVLSELQLRLKPVVATIRRILISQSTLHVYGFQAWNSVEDYVQQLTAGSLRHVPRASGYPVLGILPQMCNQGLYDSTMTTMFELARDCGLSRSSVGIIPIVYLRDPAIIRQIYAKNADGITRFGSDGKGPFGISQRLIGYTATTADGEDWHRWRNGFLKAFNNPTTLRSAYPGILRIAQRHVKTIMSTKGERDLRQVMEAYALDTVWYLALGAEDVSDASEGILAAMERFGEVVGNPSHLWRHVFRNLIRGKSFREPDSIEESIREEIEAVVVGLVQRRLDNPESEDCKFGLLQNASNKTGAYPEAPISDDILAQARQVFSLGHEASTLILFWGIYELSSHPEVVRRLREELRDRGFVGAETDYNILRSMPYLDAVVNELLRLHPPISTTARRVTRPITVKTKDEKAVVIPQGTQLFSSVHLLHRDSQIWGQTAEQFIPERWIGVNANSIQNRCEYLPFLTGSRACPSSAFVLLQLKTMLAILLSRADVVVTNAQEVEKWFGGVIRPTVPAKFQAHEITV